MLSLSKVLVSEDGTITSEWTEKKSRSPARDFERTAGGSRKFPIDFKLEVMDYVRAGHSNTETARRFKLNRKVVRDWLKQEDKLRRAAEEGIPGWPGIRVRKPDTAEGIGGVRSRQRKSSMPVRKILQAARESRRASTGTCDNINIPPEYGVSLVKPAGND